MEVARTDGAGARWHRTGSLVVVPRTEEMQFSEDMLGNALVAMIGGTRPEISTARVYSYLRNRFDIQLDVVDVRRHESEDFVVRFRHRADRDRVMGATPGGALMPLVWHPWRRTSGASATAFKFKVLVALRHVPLHARNTDVAQVVLGPSCTDVELIDRRDTPVDDDREFFVTAWCWHPQFILDEQIIYIREPRVSGVALEVQESALGLRYLICI